MHGRSSATRGIATLVVALSAAALGAPARADVVGYPPDDCPVGAAGGASHCGEYCYALRCTGDDDCEGDRACEPLDLCIEVLQCMSNGGAFTQEVVHDTCEDGAACAEGTCETARVCVPPEPDTSSQPYGCACAAAESGTAAGAAIVGLVAAAAALGLRRRRNGTTTRERGGA